MNTKDIEQLVADAEFGRKARNFFKETLGSDTIPERKPAQSAIPTTPKTPAPITKEDSGEVKVARGRGMKAIDDDTVFNLVKDHNKEGSTRSALAELLHANPVHVATALARLKEAGLVKMKGNRRSATWFLTASGTRKAAK